MKKLLLVLLFVPLISFAEYSCPFGEVNCEYPGNCGAYIDTNQDEICDHSQDTTQQVTEKKEAATIEGDAHFDLVTGKELKVMTVQEIADIYEISVEKFTFGLSEQLGIEIKNSDNFQLLHDNYGLEPSTAKDLAAQIKIGGMSVDDKDTKTISSKEQSVETSKKRYPLIPIAGVIIILYVATYFLAKKKTITLLTHRKIWNMVLTISFLISAILGILLILRINFGTMIPLPFNVLYWHVEAGIVMAVISIFHIAWHWRYYRNIFKRSN